MGWMAWTLPTAIFFATIAAILVAMTVYEIKSPCVERKGFCRSRPHGVTGCSLVC